MAIKRYWIRDQDGYYWCKTKMKPSNAKDIPENYKIQGYWSKFTESYDLKRRIKYSWFFAQLERLMIRLLGNIKVEVILIKKEAK